MNEQPLPESAESRGFRTKAFRVILLVLFLALCVGLITPVVRSVARQREFYRVHGQVRNNIQSLAARCPTGVPPAQWQKAVDWTSNLISQVYFGPVENDPDSLRELNDDLADRIKGTVDLTTLQWVWEQCENAPRYGAVYAIRFRSIRLLTKEPMNDTKVTEEGVKRFQESLPNCRIGNYAVLVDW